MGTAAGKLTACLKPPLSQHPTDTCVLLVDSEVPGVGKTALWEHVLKRPGDQWARPAEATDKQLYFMVPMVEAWLIADPEALQTFFKTGFEARKLPVGDLERRQKTDLDAALKAATKNCHRKKLYRHGLAHAVIGSVSPEKVKQLDHGERLFSGVRELLNPPEDAASGNTT